MKKLIVAAIVFILIPTICFAVRIPTGSLGLDWRTDAPTGKNWIKATDTHYFNKNSIKKVKGAIYQVVFCNPVILPDGSSSAWNYFDIRIDCKSKQTSSTYSDGWLDFSSPSDYEEPAVKYICK